MRAFFGAIILVLTLAGCGTSATDGVTEQRPTAAVSTSVSPSTPREAPPPPAFVTAPAAQAALLKTADMAQIVGDSGMRPLAEFTHTRGSRRPVSSP